MRNEILPNQIIWDKFNREHIQKHNLVPRQVEQVFIEQRYLIVPTYAGRINVIGKCGRRMLSVILNQQENDKFYLVTARDASADERARYRDFKNT